jgi:hypothetical protein
MDYGNYGSFTDINAADATLDTFEVLGNYASAFVTGQRFLVSGSTGNDNTYVVIAPGATFAAGVTTIPVTAAAVITTETAGTGTGMIFFAQDFGYDETSTAIPFSTDPNEMGKDITFASPPASGSIIEIVALP